MLLRIKKLIVRSDMLIISVHGLLSVIEMTDKSVWFVEDNFRTLMLILITRYLFIVIIILHVLLPT